MGVDKDILKGSIAFHRTESGDEHKRTHESQRAREEPQMNSPLPIPDIHPRIKIALIFGPQAKMKESVSPTLAIGFSSFLLIFFFSMASTVSTTSPSGMRASLGGGCFPMLYRLLNMFVGCFFSMHGRDKALFLLMLFVMHQCVVIHPMTFFKRRKTRIGTLRNIHMFSQVSTEVQRLPRPIVRPDDWITEVVLRPSLDLPTLAS